MRACSGVLASTSASVRDARTPSSRVRAPGACRRRAGGGFEVSQPRGSRCQLESASNRAPVASSPSGANAEDGKDPEQQVLLLTAAAVGLGAGLAVSGFNTAERFLHDVVFAAPAAAWVADVASDSARATALTILAPTGAGFAVSALRYVAGGFIGEANPREAKTSTGDVAEFTSTDDYAGFDLSDFEINANDDALVIEEKRESVSVGGKVLAKTAAAVMTLGTGCSLGPEGPSVEIGAAVAERVGAAFPSGAPSRLGLIAAGAAAGLSAGFGAPIAGLFFGFESILVPGSKDGNVNTGAATTEMVILASVLSTVVTTAILGKPPTVEVPPFELLDLVELPLYLPLGLACGATAVALRKLNNAFDDVAETFVAKSRETGGLGIDRAWHAPIGGFILGCLAVKFPQVTYQGFDNVNALLVKNATLTYTPLVLGELVLVKLIATSMCRGAGLVGGVYAPSLFMGAALGSAYGELLAPLASSFVAPPQAYALVGMAGVLAGVCRVPLTAILLLFELTHDYRIIVPLMATVSVSSWLVNNSESKAITPEDMGVAALATTLVARPRDVMREDIATLDDSATLEDAAEALLAVADTANPPPCVFVCAKSTGTFIGAVSALSITNALKSQANMMRKETSIMSAIDKPDVVDADARLQDFVNVSRNRAFAVVLDSSKRPLGALEMTAAIKQSERERLRAALRSL